MGEGGKKRLASGLAALAAGLAVYLLLWKILGLQWGAVYEALLKARLGLVAAVIAVSVLWHVVLGSDKLYRVIRAAGPPGFRPRWVDVLRLRLGTGPLRMLLPMDAGDILTVAWFSRAGKLKISSGSGLQLFDKGLNLVGSGFWLLTGIAVAGGASEAGRSLLFMALAALFGIFFLSPGLLKAAERTSFAMSRKLGRFAAGVIEPFLQCGTRQKLLFLGYGVLFMARPILVLYLLFYAFGVTVDPRTFIIFATLAVFAGHAPTAAGMGVREAAVAGLFYGQAPPDTLFSVGLLLSLTVHVIPMLAGIPWAWWYLKELSQQGGAEAGS